MYKRTIESNVLSRFDSKKVIIITGPRQVGKTTLIEKLLENQLYLNLNGDDHSDRLLFDEPSLEKLKQIIGNFKVVFVDEAQKINNVGDALKIIVDRMKNIQVIISGSSSFDLNNMINESLTGRKWEFTLYPLSWSELEENHGYVTMNQQLESRLIYGMYPDVVNSTGDEVDVLKQLTSSYLYKDILSLSNIKKPDVLDKLLKALAFQVGNEVSYNELSRTVGIDKNTVNHYIDLLCKAFVLFKLPSFSRNLRNEIKMNQKIYFVDNGIRNIIISNTNPLALRNDVGALWENFLLSERLKKNQYTNSLAQMYFWRTNTQKEIDYVEESQGQILGFEFKYVQNKKMKKHTDFIETYNAKIQLINRDNFRAFLQ